MAKYTYQYSIAPSSLHMWVQDEQGAIAWEYHHPAFYEEKDSGDLVEDSSPMELGLMKNVDDLAGLQAMLAGLLNQGDIEIVQRQIADGGAIANAGTADKDCYDKVAKMIDDEFDTGFTSMYDVDNKNEREDAYYIRERVLQMKGTYDAGGQTGDKKPVRFEAGKKLTDQEKREVYRTMKDAYKELGRPYTVEENQNGREVRIWLDNSRDYMVDSDITGRKLRWYIFMPDGKIAHPTELYPNISISEAKRVQNNMEYHSIIAEHRYNQVKAEIDRFAENDKVLDSIITALENGAKFYTMFDSSDIGQKDALTHLTFDSTRAWSVPEYIINIDDTYLGLGESDLVRVRINESRNKFLTSLSDIDWQRFLKEGLQARIDQEKISTEEAGKIMPGINFTDMQKKDNSENRFDSGGQISSFHKKLVSKIEKARYADLIELPPADKGTNCGNCKFVEIKDEKKGLGYCTHPLVDQDVTARMCCIYWDAPGVKRVWVKLRDGRVLGKRQNLPDEAMTAISWISRKFHIPASVDPITLTELADYIEKEAAENKNELHRMALTFLPAIRKHGDILYAQNLDGFKLWEPAKTGKKEHGGLSSEYHDLQKYFDVPESRYADVAALSKHIRGKLGGKGMRINKSFEAVGIDLGNAVEIKKLLPTEQEAGDVFSEFLPFNYKKDVVLLTVPVNYHPGYSIVIYPYYPDGAFGSDSDGGIINFKRKGYIYCEDQQVGKNLGPRLRVVLIDSVVDAILNRDVKTKDGQPIDIDPAFLQLRPGQEGPIKQEASAGAVAEAKSGDLTDEEKKT